MVDGPKDEPVFVLSTLPAGRAERRLAGVVVLLSLAVFVAAVPFARQPLPRVTAFIPAYESALVISDLITAALLFGQFSIIRSRALLVLASGYLFCGLIEIAHGLTYPDVFSATGLLGAGTQSTAWLYMFWHGGFPLAVLGYALLKNRPAAAAGLSEGFAIAASVVVVTGFVAVLTLLATAGEASLPPIMAGNHYTPALIFVVGAVWALSLLALVVLVLRRPHAVLDLWLMAVMCTWLCDVALSAMLNAARYDFGFYAGRIYGLAAASFVLIMLLLETISLYARLARSTAVERRERERRLSELHAELVHVSRVSELGQMVSALAHEVNQPLTAIGNYLRGAQRLAQSGDAATVQAAVDKAAEETARASAIVRRLRDFIRKRDAVRRCEELGPMLEETVSLALVGVDRWGINVEVRVDPRASAALVDRIQIQQVLLNLIRNAVDAAGGGTRLALVLATVPADGGMIEMSVADTGPGLSAAVREKLFQPFVTTKRDGMGVGLSICRSIVEAHGGRIWAEDNPGGGTVFRFTVPDALAAAQEEAA
ncbi:MAG TPA: MASE4 domain-containing protein [Acetobacteraceae bacterium]|jgi:two-component system, sensor histidine kinase and response regulator|nr:MASE4 domain-containing protein [Acetobacteraceae bacterium]